MSSFLQQNEQYKEFLASLRPLVTPDTWSKGVELARSENINLKSTSNEDEHDFVVVDPSKTIHPEVKLWPQDEDWHCSCGDKSDPCHHVVACAIALKQSADSNKPLPKFEQKLARIGYRFRRTNDGLSFERVIVDGSVEKPLTFSLLSPAPKQGPTVHSKREDLTIDHILLDAGGVALAKFPLKKIFEILTNLDDIRLDNESIRCSTETKGAVISITDEGGGVRLTSHPASSITEVFKNGFVLCKETLHLQSQPALTAAELALVSKGRFFGQKEMPELVSEIIPTLSEKIPITIHGKNLPQKIHVESRIVVDTKIENHVLKVKSWIVYGDPILAHIDALDRLLLTEGTKVPLRDLNIEEQLKQKLKQQLNLRVHQELLLEPRDAISWVRNLNSSKIFDVQGEGWRSFRLQDPLKVKMGFDESENFQVSFVSESSNQVHHADPLTVLKAWKRGESLVPLEMGGGWARMPLDWIKKHGAKLFDILQGSSKTKTTPAYLMPDITDLCQSAGLQLPSKISAFMESLQQSPDLTVTDIAWEKIQADFRPYQKEGIVWLKQRQKHNLGALLADDMGLGKTLQTLSLFDSKTLVIAPTSVLANWQSEILRFRRDLRVCLYHGANRKWNESCHVTLTSYALVRLENDFFAGKEWTTIVLDEAQVIKNPASQVARACCQLNGNFRVALSGTPIENHPEDLWSLFHFLNPGLLGDFSDFRERYSKGLSQGDEAVSSHLRARLRPFVLRRTKAQVAKDLPARLERIVMCELNDEEKQVYTAIKAQMDGTLLSSIDGAKSQTSTMHLLEALLRLRQICCHPQLLSSKEGFMLSEITSSKTALLMECLEESLESQHCSLIFSQWTRYLDIIGAELTKRGIVFLRIDGSTRNRAEIVAAFQNGEAPILLLSLKAAGVGLNLTAADHIFITDPWWNPAAEDQAADRAHRIGQDKSVIIHKLVCQNTVEEKILQLQRAKRALVESVVSENEADISFSGGLLKEELISLLQ